MFSKVFVCLGYSSGWYKTLLAFLFFYYQLTIRGYAQIIISGYAKMFFTLATFNSRFLLDHLSWNCYTKTSEYFSYFLFVDYIIIKPLFYWRSTVINKVVNSFMTEAVIIGKLMKVKMKELNSDLYLERYQSNKSCWI